MKIDEGICENKQIFMLQFKMAWEWRHMPRNISPWWEYCGFW